MNRRLLELLSEGGQSVRELHVLGSSFQIAAKSAAARDQLSELFQGIQREFEFVVLEIFMIAGEQHPVLFFIGCGRRRQRASGAFEQHLRDFPAFPKFGVGHGRVRSSEGSPAIQTGAKLPVPLPGTLTGKQTRRRSRILACSSALGQRRAEGAWLPPVRI